MENGGPDPARSDEEEALKRNTDCVYFLASPLTCKKGAECEYRHSEGARVNPRDCWYWLNGNCLNPKCSFRHPPLDDLLGGTATPSAPGLQGEDVLAPQAFPLHASATQTTNKQNIPCFYFRKGMCAKGGMCPYMHGPAPAPTTNNPVPHHVPPIAENPLMLKKSTWSLNKCTQENTLRTTNEPPAVPVVSSVKPTAESVKLPNNALTVKTSSVPVQMKVELPPRLQSSSISTGSGNGHGRPESPQDEAPDDFIQNGRESEEFLRESSPGFDVLVDGQTEDSEYYHEGGEYASGNTDYHHSADYATASNLEREPYEGLGDYDQHMEVRDPFGRERHRFPERSLERSSIPERRRSRRDESPVEMEGFDLRHQLRKQRKLSDSSFNSNQRRPHRREDYEPRGSQKDQIPHNGSISKRLQGRINLPSRESGDRPVDMYSRDIERGRNWGRSSSPGRPTRYQGRLHDRLSLRAHGDFPADLRNTGNLSATRREETGIRQFSGPKSLTELKDSKVSDRSDRFARYNGDSISDESKTRSGTLIGREETNPGSFEGPKPLSEILKQKRAAASKSEKVNDKVESSTSNNKEEHQPLSNQCEHEIEAVEEEEGIIPAGSDEQQQIEASVKDNETENVVVVDDMEDAEYYEEGDEEYYYEEVEGEEYKGDDGNVYEEHYVEEGKEFAKEDGAMLS